MTAPVLVCIMSTSEGHERIKKWLADLLEIHFEEIAVELTPRGQATMRAEMKTAGAEPDESWCIGGEKQYPDLVLEIALTSGGINKLKTYRRFEIPEVCFWRRNHIEVFVLSASGDYQASPSSRLLPGLDLALLERCAAIQNWQQARRTFRAAISSAK
jgi:Uma2 family endonuclease